MPPRLMTREVSFGDSLSDRGNMYKRLLLGVIPMAQLSGLTGKSPDGRFTNQYTWLDNWARVMAESTYIKQLEKEGRTPEDIMERLLNNDDHKKEFLNSFNLDNSLHVRYYGQEFYDTYCQGGATARNWKELTLNITFDATRKIVSNLEKERALFLAEEEAKHVTQEEKDTTLITVFIGANDLITVNDPKDPKIKEIIAKAVRAQMEHIQALIAKGYSNFSLMNLPNLGYTPRFQAMKGGAELGKRITNLYNTELKNKYAVLTCFYPDTKLHFSDINKMFQEVYENPAKYGFAKDKLTTYFKDSAEFKENPCHSGAYMFWDEVHPTAKMHQYLEEKINADLSPHFSIEPPAQGYQFHVRKTPPNKNDIDMLHARRGTTILLYPKGEQHCIGFWTKNEFKEVTLTKQQLNALTDHKKEKIQELNNLPNKKEIIYTLVRSPMLKQQQAKKFKTTDDIPDQLFNRIDLFGIVDNLIIKNNGYGFEKSSLMFEFARAYKECWTEQVFSSFFGSSFLRSRIDPYNSTIEEIFQHALVNGGERSRSVMIDLGWIDKQNKLRHPFSDMESIKHAYKLAEKALADCYTDYRKSL